ncbi:MAG: MarR family transcriptional regulator [Thermoproteales archaeon]|nr:MarR family transcriptional regulator [Thermoproteales archaeon]
MSGDLCEILSNIEKKIKVIENKLENIERILSSMSKSPVSLEMTHPGIERVPRIYPSLPELTPSEREVLRIIEERGEVTANSLAELLNISTSSATRYLRGLYRLGLIRRRERRSKGGKEVIYYR